MANVIELWVTDSLPMRAIFDLMPTTVVTDIMSWNKAYSLFPLSTHIQRKGYLLKELEDYITSAEYTQQGWKLEELMWPEEKRLNHPIRHTRRVGDRFTWTIPLNTEGVTGSKTPDYVLEHACFGTSVNGDDGSDADLSNLFYNTPPDSSLSDHERVSHYTITARKIIAKTLKYAYTCSNTRMRDYIRLRVDRTTLMELRKIGLQDFDEYVADPHNIHKRIENIERPATWTYWDDELPKWYKAWEQAETKRVEKIGEDSE